MANMDSDSQLLHARQVLGLQLLQGLEGRVEAASVQLRLSVLKELEHF